MFESSPHITIRRLRDEESGALARLAERDSAAAPTGPVIAAFTPGGAMLAAISLVTREVVADPFLPTAHAAALLRSRARQMHGDRDVVAPRSRRFRLRRRRSHATGHDASLAGSPPGAAGLRLTLRPPS